jgi:hypothetical protein
MRRERDYRAPQFVGHISQASLDILRNQVRLDQDRKKTTFPKE